MLGHLSILIALDIGEMTITPSPSLSGSLVQPRYVKRSEIWLCFILHVHMYRTCWIMCMYGGGGIDWEMSHATLLQLLKQY